MLRPVVVCSMILRLTRAEAPIDHDIPSPFDAFGLNMKKKTTISSGGMFLKEQGIRTLNATPPDEGPKDCRSQRLRQMQQLKDASSTERQSVFLPYCDPSDSKLYSRTQCHSLSGYCWCVNATSGVPISGSSTIIPEKPTCDGRSRNGEEGTKSGRGRTEERAERRKKPRKKPKDNTPPEDGLRHIKRCYGEKRDRFYRKLISTFVREREETLDEDEEEEEQELGRKERRRRAIQWKFAQLDEDENDVVERREWRDYRAGIRMWDGVRTCARNFFRFCDADLNRAITREEWQQCTVFERKRLPKPPAPTVAAEDRNPFLYLLKPDPAD